MRHKFQKIIQFVTENGIQESYSDDLKDNIRVVNFLATFFFLGNISELFVTHGTAYLIGSLMSIFWNAMVLVLLRLKYHLAGRLVFSVFMIPLFYWMGICVLPDESTWQLTVQFIMSSFIIMPFMVLGVNERRFLYLIVFFYFVVLFLYYPVYQWIDYQKEGDEMPAPVEIAPAVVSIMVVIAFAYYQQVIRRAHQKIAGLLGLTQEKNEELKLQKEEITSQRDSLDTVRKQLQKQNEDITAGINYASRIQNAMLPEVELINKYLPENFIFFRPRDIVSGDFYWCQEKNDTLILVVADCTGHGVPGAFMSMIGSALLDKITLEMGIISPDLILTKLHQNIRKSLHQATSENRDGMDLVCCSIDFQTKTLEFAGAKNPLLYVQNNQLIRLKGDRFAIGGRQTETERIFHKQTVKFDQSTMFYLFSDGFQDQFGGKKDKKYMSKRFRELLGKISNENMDTQKNILNQELSDWMKGDYEQTDDILVMGFRI